MTNFTENTNIRFAWGFFLSIFKKMMKIGILWFLKSRSLTLYLYSGEVLFARMTKNKTNIKIGLSKNEDNPVAGERI